ncbi:ATP-binding protein [Micromonospora inyonensis]|uniref:DNA replication protein DnaC n=1 Tax=Micromonospora inyonensis TaxID=47866 RepID=A0A1C6R712_9ACTN|nr:ATP-binding protein [Micromonospora inyonensis]SCL12802.1 DNA replication protein DnaC [Micromonospora inyonensis]SCL21637.1 phage DNA replication protein (predicted replicative helicase loader) [Micromonospora inyonensis]
MTAELIRNPLREWQRRIWAHAVIDDTTPSHDELSREADRAERAAIHARQAANRAIAYTRRRPSRYANASYELLLPEQDPAGKVSRWRAHGPRALLIAGPARTGKTTAAYAIANDTHAHDQWVMVWTAPDLSAALKPDGEPFAYDYATGCDLLVLDDLGRERVTDWWLEQLQRILDERCAQERRLVVTCNTTGPDEGDDRSPAEVAYAQLVTRYGHPIVERLIDGGGVLVLDGPAVRQVVTEW